MIVLPSVILYFLLFKFVNSFIINRVGGNSAYKNRISSTLSEIEISKSEKLRVWFLLNHGKRASNIYHSEVSTLQVSDMWKSILISYRMHEADRSMTSYISVHDFSNIKIKNPKDLSEYYKSSELLEEILKNSFSLFQPSFSRKISFVPNTLSKGENDEATLIMIMETFRLNKVQIDFESDDDVDYSPGRL